ncbi:PREDICTED: transcription elongation factor SPT6 homolog [Camelina sativa]|uniref:Transcription elongation factor SPT6 homolog n=1 Tax=Camelina sativa TaxID=90675 RepID=A0ABM1R7M9_CAMSA|nr:PREDICTED: transcription elongation factor SPT6 homolog [Camelina sativa]
MVATLCGPGKEILAWNLHSLQNFLDRDDKCRMVEQVMVYITNQDWRTQYREPSVYEELSMISGETITEGRIVQATVHRYAGAVSPPGGDFSDPVSSATLSIAQDLKSQLQELIHSETAVNLFLFSSSLFPRRDFPSFRTI